MRSIFFIGVLLLLSVFTQAQQMFNWKWQVKGDSVVVLGELTEAGKKISVSQPFKLTQQRFVRLYYIIDEIEYGRLSLYERTIDTLSRLLVKPFADELKKCSRINVMIDTVLLNFPIEFLAMNKTALAVFKPIVFAVNGYSNDNAPGQFSLHKGFIIRDSTSDPEYACINIFHQFPLSEYRNAYNVHENDLGLKKKTDFILISAHGYADSLSFRGGIGVNKIERIDPTFFKLNDPRLIYLDGCQQGINWSYISALAETPKANFYLGPLVSNDSGESSTKTINWFFEQLKQTKDPVISIFRTRQKLFSHYSGHIKKMEVINKSFIFRIYKI